MQEQEQLPASVTRLEVDGKEVYLVGTAHVSKESVEEVRETIEKVRPDTVCVELCESRYKAMTQPDAWKRMDIFKVIREQKTLLLLAQLAASSFYRRLGEKLGVQPGAEMLEAIKAAEQHGSALVLADRDVQVTLKRVYGFLGFWTKLRLVYHLTMSMFSDEKISEELVEKIKRQDQLETLLEEFTKKFPEIKKRLIDERDIFLAQKIRHVTGRKVVAVVGAGHVKGIHEHIGRDEPTEELVKLPPPSHLGTILKWGIPAGIIALLAYTFFTQDREHSIRNIYIWILTTGSLSAAGAAAGLAHPLAIVTAFLAAPFTTLHPLLAAGWFAGIAQAWVKRPTVADFEGIHDAIMTLKGFWTHPVIKILLITALSNLGSMIGLWIAGAWIAARAM